MRQLRYRLNVRADRGDINDLIYRPPQGVSLPDRAANAQWRAPIRDQGEEGACSAFTGRGAMEYLRAKHGYSHIELAPQALYNRILQIENNGDTSQDTGAQIRSIPKALNQFGICREILWPYEKHKFSEAPDGVATADATRFMVGSYQRVTSIYDLRYAIAIDKLAVMIGVSVYQSMMSDAVAQTGLVPVPQKGDKLVGGHALLTDSYDFTRSTAPVAVFEGPNSWNDDWGAPNASPNASGAKRGIYRMPVDFVQSTDCLNDVWVLTH